MTTVDLSWKLRAQKAEAELTTLRASLEQAQKERDKLHDMYVAANARSGRLRAELEQVRGTWVSVEERLPEMDGITYMVYGIEYKTGIRFVDIVTAQNQAAWYNFGQRKLPSGITHWQPLPDPPFPSKEGN